MSITNHLTFLLVVCLFPLMTRAQLSDDFSDGDFTSNPTWSGVSGHFVVNSSEQLQVLNAAPTGADVSYLTTQFSSTGLDDKEWQFWIKQSFAGSANNYGRVWLASSETDPTSLTNEGYFLQFGEAGSNDAIELFYSVGGITTSVCRGLDAFVAGSFEIRLRVRRSSTGAWSVEVDPDAGYSFAPHASGNHALLGSSENIGVVCRYTASNADKFSYDDFYFGAFILDVTAPSVTSVTTISTTEIDVKFSEPITQTTAEDELNYIADGGLNNPVSAVQDLIDLSLVHLTFASTFTNGTTYQLTVSNIQDGSSNVMTTSSHPFQYVVTSPANFRDVVINEFMCDPSPIIGLPELEFVEVYNTSSNYIDLTGWKLGDAAGFGTVGSHVIAPSSYAVLVATNSVPSFSAFSNVVPVSSFPSLNNTGDNIILQDTGLITIDQIGYDLSWYHDEAKEDGGYSIEQINPFAACANSNNWAASTSAAGGTPGSINSVYNDAPDTLGPSLSSVAVTGSQSLELRVSESLNLASLSPSSFVLDPVNAVIASIPTPPSNQVISIILDQPLDTGVVYTIYMLALEDCETNPQYGDTSATFILPFSADSGDLVINEILFNPYTGGYDYIELANTTDRPVNLKGWQLASFDEEVGVSNIRTIAFSNYAVAANGYVVVTEDSSNVMMNYIQHGLNNFIETDIPSYNNDSGTVYLLNVDSIIMESFSYNEDMHFPLLSTVDGVSLERLDINRSVRDPGNWHSAAETVGFGTPGLENSQYYPTIGAIGEVNADPDIFSPDNDGHNDVLNINFSFTEPGFVGTIRIYDSNGRPVRELATNELLATSGTFTWDGTTDGGEKARIGAYVILFEAFSTNGQNNTYKFTTVLGGRL